MSVNTLLRQNDVKWLETPKKERDVVIMSRIRLARNLKDYVFPNRADLNELSKVQLAIDKVVPDIEADLEEPLDRMDMERLSPLQQQVLIDKRLISDAFVKKTQHRVAYVAEKNHMSIMVNEDDHLRIQCMAPGLDLDTPYELASEVDDVIENKLDMAFDEKMGYLTSCPTNLGTGLRASVLLHLPGMVYTRNINSLINISPQLGLAVRPVFGDEKDQVGCLYRISNQQTLGFSEKELIDNLKSAVREIISHERRARKALSLYRKDELEDEVWRAFGTLSYARLLTEHEALELGSKLRLGVDMKILPLVDADVFLDILFGCRASYLQNLAENDNLSKNEIDRLRADKVREILAAHRVSQGAH